MTLRSFLAVSSAIVALAAVAPAQAQAPARQSTSFTLSTGSPRAPEQLAMQFDLADLAIKVMPATKTIDAVATLHFTATAPLTRLVVELDTVFDVSTVTVDGQDLTPDQWSNPEGRMTVDLPAPLAAGQTVALRVAYSGAPRVAPMAPWDGGFVWSQSPDGRPWIATAIQGEGCDLFWPCIDYSLAEPGRVDLHITVPSDLSAPSNGRFLGKTDHGDGWTTWNWTAAHPNTYAIALNIGAYDVLTADYHSRYGNTFPITYWYLKSDDPAKAQALFDEFAPMLDFFEATIGPYPFGDEKMGVVETPHLGMEHQTINAYGNGYKLDGRGFDWLLQHEFSHEWFGNQLTNANADDMWLHEGLGSYMQPLYDRWLHGDRYMQYNLAEQRKGVANRFPIVSGTPKEEDEVYKDEVGPGLDIYNKGSLISHSLRMLIGDRAFFSALRRLVYDRPDPQPGNFQPHYASTEDFLRIVNSETHSDLTWFFRAYLYQAALPELRETRVPGERGSERLSLEWVTGDGGAFPMPLEIEIDGRPQTLAMRGNRGTVEVPAGAHVLIDPENKVLRRMEFIDSWRAYDAVSRVPRHGGATGRNAEAEDAAKTN